MTGKPDMNTAFGRLWCALWDNYGEGEKLALIDAFVSDLADTIRDASAGAEGDAFQAIHYAADVIDPAKRVTRQCGWCWGSHGCSLPEGHPEDRDHWCDHRPVSFDSVDTPDEKRPHGHADLFLVQPMGNKEDTA